MKTGKWVHLCVDMQRMFEEETPWQAKWMSKIADQVTEVATRSAQHTIFTRFVPPTASQDMAGMWRTYYDKWPMMTATRLEPGLIDLISPLQRLVPPARILDKRTYSPWLSGTLERLLIHDHVEEIVITGGETDVCVLATVLGAIDLGMHVVLLKDAVYSSADTTHDAALLLLGNRFSVQVEIATTEEWLMAMPSA
ncbi:cysteine hydrolase (plasmid) [Ensifer adhaerens]|uniref:cysteine hydrolase family protein n=1 Tax=Ensifer adhaerens TaxID=106592 RepID=UPI001CBEE535|nr:cysteine hydrolase [Ensifer adhaerens]MBZ7927673.1 cysteine hydrolase [Ensifer adhaerens]UAX98069.1 cysteine hydrolase [Ensifer adhaerens]UAY05450.1 cysteine hydrolase [Ensifer adhaerens]UAY12828.1 cysteine hydrolase [Ensifer adhaerens]